MNREFLRPVPLMADFGLSDSMHRMTTYRSVRNSIPISHIRHSVFGRPFVKRFALEVGLSPGDIVLDGDPAASP